MKHLAARVLLAGLGVIFAAHPAAAQLQNLPVYFSPKGGIGLTIAGDFGQAARTRLDGINTTTKPTAFGGRVSLGLPMLTVGVGAATYDPKYITLNKEKQFMGNAALKVFGGPLVPVSVSVQAGVGYLKQVSGPFSTTTISVPLGVGAAVNVPTPGVSLSPWAAARVQLNAVSSGDNSATQTGYGLSGGVNLGLPLGFGLHAALDWSMFSRKTSGIVTLQKRETLVVGLGLHYTFKIPGLGVPIVPGI